jgi:fatty-acyl-CoA synthase
MTNSVIKFRTLSEALAAAPAERPFITFWIDEDECESVTFGAFRRRAQSQADQLRRRGVCAGDRVVILMPQGISAMAVFAGVMMAGGVPAFLAYPNFKIEPSKYRSGLEGVTANLRAKAVVIDHEFPEEFLAYVSLYDDAKVIRAAIDGGMPTIEEHLFPLQNPNDLAFIQHSAGTTGLQKAVALSHKAVLTQLTHLAEALQIDSSSDRIYNWLPLYHDMGLIACFMLPMVCHVPVVMQSPLDWVMRPEAMLQIITEHRCTLAWMPNFAFQFVPRRTPQNRWSKYDLSSLRALINCSEPVRARSMDEFQNAFDVIGLKGTALQSSYAMAENVFAVTQSTLSAKPARVWANGGLFRCEHRIQPAEPSSPGSTCFVSSGRLLPSNKVQIVSDSGAQLPDGRVGEIYVQSDSLFEGYYHRPDLTETAIVDGWYHTGDLGFCLAGELYVVGRKKDLLIIGGENLYPQDIEEVVSAHPEIHDGRAIAMGIYNPDVGTEEVLVVAEVNHDESLAESERIEQELRSSVVSALGVAAKTIVLKPPKWIVKSTAGKAARAATCEKLLREHPEFRRDS